MDTNIELSQAIIDNAPKLAQEIVRKQHGERENLTLRFKLSSPGLVEYTQTDLYYLAEALRVQQPAIYENQVCWLQSMMRSYGVPEFVVSKNLEATLQVLLENLAGNFSPLIQEYIDKSAARLNQPGESENTLMSESAQYYELAWRFLKSLLAGDRQQGGQIILSAAQSGTSIPDLYMKVIQPCLYEVGRLWHGNKISVAQEHYFSAATQMIMSQLYPLIVNRRKNGKCMIACCAPGELHEIGLRMVVDVMEMRGWDTHYLGPNTPLIDIPDLIKEKKAAVLMLSASGPTYFGAIRTIINSVHKEIPGKVKVLAGGYFFNLNPAIARSIPADGFAANAIEAANVAERLVGISS